MPILTTRCPHCGAQTRDPRHCLDKKRKGPKLQTHCPDCGEPSKDPDHCAYRPDCGNPRCLNKAFLLNTIGPPDSKSVGVWVCASCAGIECGPDETWDTVPTRIVYGANGKALRKEVLTKGVVRDVDT